MRRAISLMFGLASNVFLVSCGGGGGGQQIMVTIDPTSTIVTVSEVTPFKDTVTGTTNTAVNWEVNGVVGGTASTGTISASGAYTAPAQVPNPAKVTITVVLQAEATKSASAAVTIVSHTPNEAAQSLADHPGDDRRERQGFFDQRQHHYVLRRDAGIPGSAKRSFLYSE